MANSLEKFARNRWYVSLVLGVWVFAPELRRYVDWRSTFHSLSILSVLPLAVLLPGVLVFFRDWQRMGTGYRRAASLWFIGFGYATFIALIHLSILSATYSLLEFCLPLGFGALLLAPRENDFRADYSRFADATLFFVALSSLYGIYQYVSPPPWDVYWAQQADIESSQGATLAFGFRIFGTLNSTGPMANAAMLSILLNLPRLSFRRWYVAAGLVPTVAALALTQVRSAWLGVAVGMLCYILFCARRTQALASLAIIAGIIALCGLGAATSSKDFAASLTSLTDRVASLGDLGYDQSAADRQEETQDAFSAALAEPLGLGLGAFGVSAKLSVGSLVNLDSGYFSRLLEMGAFGFLFFMASLVTAMVYSFRALSRARRSRDFDAADLIAVGISVQIVLLFFESGADSHLSFLGMFFWSMVSIASQFGANRFELQPALAEDSKLQPPARIRNTLRLN